MRKPLPRKQNIAWYGWNPDLPDARDHMYAAPPHIVAKMPPKVDLRPKCPSIYDQGQLGSCTGNAIAGAIQFDRMRQKLKSAASLTPSRLFIYYNERVIERTVSHDDGAQIRDGIKTVAHQGVCFESGPKSWPYDIKKFADQPPKPSFDEALDNQIISYSRLVPNLSQLKGCLASGFPFVFGFTVYEAFESDEVAKTGILSMPKSNERTMGGHAVLAVGYDDGGQNFIIRNSWGTDWGFKGYFLMPYAYLTNSNLSDDFWTIRMVEVPK